MLRETSPKESRIMPRAARLLKKNVEKVIDLKLLFPRSKPNFRTGLNSYQAKKIRRALREIHANTSGEIKNQVSIKNRAQRISYMRDNGLPKWQKVIILPGGEKINKNVEYRNGELTYTRAGEKRSRYKLYTAGTSDDLKNSAKEILKNRKGRKATITAAGKAIGAVVPTEEDKLIIREALYIFNKYESMYEKKEYRYIKRPDGTRHRVIAAHPNDWGMGILFEENKPKKERKKRK